MTPFNYLSLTAILVLTGISLVVPLLAALLTRGPSAVTGLLTLLASAATGFLVEWAQTSSGAYDWKRGLFNALLSWGIAIGSHSKILKGEPVESRAYAFPPARRAP